MSKIQNCQLLLFLSILLHFFKPNTLFYSDFEINLQTIKTKNNQAELNLKKKNKISFSIIFLSKLKQQKPIRNLYFSLGIVYNEFLKLTVFYLFLILLTYYNQQERL
ncbi:hypothetical protein C4F50_09365 [Flavobacterium sp. KB82]|uniref:Transmembrane protein n=1 Tax=Flavobacterium hungaricum TaxID=2082725 RepID=A0ABR9TIR1_9FLAO|nr:hypothetical protein [Flavobacterium hungaricum]